MLRLNCIRPGTPMRDRTNDDFFKEQADQFGRTLTPDWTERGTKEWFLKEYKNLEWKGIGWYLVKGTNDRGPYESSVLFVPAGKKDGQEQFRAFFWNHHQAASAFHFMAMMPVRVDQR